MQDANPTLAPGALDLDAIAARARMAISGEGYPLPWQPQAGSNDGRVYAANGALVADCGGHEARAEFFAHAVEDVPALVAEVRRLRAENATLQRECFLTSQAVADEYVRENTKLRTAALAVALPALEEAAGSQIMWAQGDTEDDNVNRRMEQALRRVQALAALEARDA